MKLINWIATMLFALGVAACGTQRPIEVGEDAGFNFNSCEDEFRPCADPRCCVLRACEGVGVCSGPRPDAGEPDAAPDAGQPDVPVPDAGPDAGQPDGPRPECATDEECTDYNACNGEEICADGTCVDGEPPAPCNDGIECTEDACNPASGVCEFTPNNARCGVGYVCNPGGCSCASDVVCSNGLACDGFERCVGGTCVAGGPPICDDGDPATIDVCENLGFDGYTCRFPCRDGACPPPPECDHDQVCTTGCGTIGIRYCVEGRLAPCMAPAESCNGCDDTGDGRVDEGYLCAARSVEACRTACNSSGTSTCSDRCLPGSCVSPVESCNGVDDDCDGAADNGFLCAAGAMRACTTGCGSTGTQVCTDSCSWGSCQIPVETCNGADDNCDGARDNGLQCELGSSRTCPMPCRRGGEGRQYCLNGCVWGSCENRIGEICDNGLDDDCDLDGLTPDTCDDARPSEICGNGVDDDGDGTIDENCVPPPTCRIDREILQRPRFEDNADPATLGLEWFNTRSCADLNSDGDTDDSGECGVCSGTISPTGGAVTLRRTGGLQATTSCQLAQIIPQGLVRDGENFQLCAELDFSGPGVELVLEVLGHEDPWVRADGVKWHSFGPLQGSGSYCSDLFVAGAQDQDGDGTADPVPQDEDLRFALHYGHANEGDAMGMGRNEIIVRHLSFMRFICAD